MHGITLFRPHSHNLVKFLIDNKANVNTQSKRFHSKKLNATPLHFVACPENYNEQTVELLLTARADINAKDERGNTPLYYALESEKEPRLADIKHLIENKANIDEYADNGRAQLEKINPEEIFEFLEKQRKFNLNQ